MLAVHLVSYLFSKVQDEPTKELDRFLQALHLGDEQLRDISGRLLAEMKKGLSAESNAAAAVKMLPTHVRSTPDGSEKGEFLALDLGGSRFKVLCVKVREGAGARRGGVEMQEKVFPIPEELLEGRGAELFDHVSESLKYFVHENNINLEEKHPLAFTFSFPCEQSSLGQGLLLDWSKNFHARGVRGKDVVQALREAIGRTGGLDVDVLALVNDTVATMMTCGLDDKNCEVGLIVGTGTNACYMEELRHIDLVEGDEGRMCVNTEWGAFGEDGALKDYITEFDREVDAASNNPGKQIFEKMVSGMYLGELVRLVVLKMAKLGLLFDGRVSSALRTRGKISTADVAAMEEYRNGLKNTGAVLNALGLTPSLEDCVAVQRISATVSHRSSNLVAAGLVAILTRIKENRRLRTFRVTVGVDGSVYRTHPQYPKRLHAAVRRLLPECQVRFVVSERGSSRGAALVTAAAQRRVSLRHKVEETLSPLRLSCEQLQMVKDKMRAGLEAGLRREGRSEMKMLPSFACQLPEGSEHGDVLVLALEGTFLKAFLVNFTKDQQEPQLQHKIYPIPAEITQGAGTEFFDHMAGCVSDFLDYMGIKNSRLPAGLSFPFPCVQTSVDEAILLSWTKGAGATDCEGHQVVRMLQESIERRNDFELDVAAVVNDAVGTMVACAQGDPQCELGLIVGTGTNLCYTEELKNMENMENTQCGKDDLRMCINTEWWGLGDDGSLDDITTSYDVAVDRSSHNPGKQRFEKMIGGMYLGEVVRQTLLDLTRGGLLFRGHVTEALTTPRIFQTKHLSQIESDRLTVLQVRSVLQGLGLDCTCDDCVIVKEVCAAVSRRAAQLCGAAMAAVVEKMREDRGLDHLSITAGVDGAVYRLHPHFSRVLQETLTALAPQCVVTFLTVDESSIRGAALITAGAAGKI